jgi:hypothetical protein
VRLHRLLLFPLVALLGAAVVVLPALAASSEAKLEVAENCNSYLNWQCWTAPGASPTPAVIKLAAGGVVTFADKTNFPASITWKGAAPTCSATVPVIPAAAATGWEGTCKFEAPGTYQLETPGMYYPKATIEVSAPTTSTTGTTTTGSTSSGSSGSSTMGSGSGSPTSAQSGVPTATNTPLGALLVGSQSSAVMLGTSQHGRSVHGSIDLASAAVGGRLEVTLLARGASLAGAGHSGRVRVGRVVRSSLHAGSVSFAVALDAAAAHTLRIHGHLALAVKIVLAPLHGSALTITRSVLLRG